MVSRVSVCVSAATLGALAVASAWYVIGKDGVACPSVPDSKWSVQLPRGCSPFGTISLLPTGDLDSDGVLDLAVAIDTDAGAMLCVYSAMRGQELWEFQVPDSRGVPEFCGAGDVDSDGVGDLAVSGPDTLYILSGLDGSLLDQMALPGSRVLSLSYCNAPESVIALCWGPQSLRLLGIDFDAATEPVILLDKPIPSDSEYQPTAWSMVGKTWDDNVQILVAVSDDAEMNLWSITPSESSDVELVHQQRLGHFEWLVGSAMSAELDEAMLLFRKKMAVIWFPTEATQDLPFPESEIHSGGFLAVGPARYWIVEQDRTLGKPFAHARRLVLVSESLERIREIPIPVTVSTSICRVSVTGSAEAIGLAMASCDERSGAQCIAFFDSDFTRR